MPAPNPPITPTQPTPVVTRFAPSPTGHLHIGGARTALFNWAFARHHQGTFILRIEDTDQKRSTEQSTRTLINDLQWLNLNWDAGPHPQDPYNRNIGPENLAPYFQSKRLNLYQQHTDQLLQQRRAYYCFKTPEQLNADRQLARREKRPYKYDHNESFNLAPTTVQQFLAEKRPAVIRFRMPDTDITVNDTVLGPVTLKADQLEDFVIQKSDGFPTFHLANVVDDHHMTVTHVLRGQEHLMNTPKHVALQQALNLNTPTYAHMPLIFNPDGSKMSKRDKAKTARAAAKQHNLTTLPNTDPDTLQAFLKKDNDDIPTTTAIAQHLNLQLPEIDVHDFRASGYLPEVLLNYIALLGWSPGDNIERFDTDFLAQHFDATRIGKSNARFDRDKLLNFNTDSTAKLTPEQFQQIAAQHDQTFYNSAYQTTLAQDNFTRFCNAYRERSRTIQEPFDNGRFFLTPDQDITLDSKAVKKVLQKNDNAGYQTLKDLLPLLQNTNPWTPQNIEHTLTTYAESKNLNLGKVAQPLRVALTGNTISPPIYDTLAILGQTPTLTRITQALSQHHP